MAKVSYSSGIDSVSGLLSPRSSKHSCQQRLLAKHLKNSDDCTRLYLGKKPVRSTPFSAKEKSLQTKFGVLHKAAIERSQDLGHLTADQAAYAEARKKTGFKYHSILGWLFGRAKEYYNESSGKVDWPDVL